MSTNDAEDSATNSPASFASLPLELKSLIVKMCNAQDQAYQFRILDPDCEKVGGSELSGVLKENKWRGKSTNALFLVNSELSGLAAVDLFKVLPSFAALSPLFRYLVLRRRSKLITTLDITSSDSTPDILSYASMLENLDSIIVSQDASFKLFGSLHQNSFNDPRKSSSGHQLHLSAVSSLQQKILNLTLLEHTSSQAANLSSYFSNLIYLKIELIAEDSAVTEESITNVGLFLASSTIEHFSLQSHHNPFPSSWPQIDWTKNQLRILDLTLYSFPAELFSFLGNFSATLEQLNLSEDTVRKAEKFQLVEPLRNLKRLSLTAHKSTLLPLLELFSNSPVDSIILETMDYHGRYTTSWRTGLRRIIDRYKGLKALEFIDRFDSYDFFPDLVEHCQKQRIWLKFSRWKFLYEEDIDIPNCQQFKFRRSILKESFKFAEVRLEELEEENNVEGLKEMYENCKWLRAVVAERKD